MKKILFTRFLLFFASGVIIISCKKETHTSSSPLPPLPPPTSLPQKNPCSNRPVVNATLTPFGSLSTARSFMSAATAGSKILFAGGFISDGYSSRVDIYDTITKSWSAAELSIKERQGMAVATVGSKIFFAGGMDGDGMGLQSDVKSRVDIYDAATNIWSTAELSEPRAYLAAATLGDKIFFAGGANWGPLMGTSSPAGWPQNANYFVGWDVVDIYDNNTNSWTTARLSEGRYELSATTVGNKIYFAGGLNNIFSISTTIDIYDALSNTWSISKLQKPRTGHAGVASGNKIIWAGGAVTSYMPGYLPSNDSEIRDLSSGLSSFECFYQSSSFKAAQKNDIIVFISGSDDRWTSQDKFDIYNISTNAWSTGALPVSIRGAAVISINNTIYVAGGQINGAISNQVWKLEF
jgi:N-acetylneuraminic acid mutarotase